MKLIGVKKIVSKSGNEFCLLSTTEPLLNGEDAQKHTAEYGEQAGTEFVDASFFEVARQNLGREVKLIYTKDKGRLVVSDILPVEVKK